MAGRQSKLCQKQRDDDDRNTETKRQKPTTLKQISPATNLTDLNDDCLQHIFELLGPEDLFNVANSNKWLNPAACVVFSKKHGQKQICFGYLANNLPIFNASSDKLVIRNLKTSFQFLRCFGRCITKLKVNYGLISNRNRSNINQYFQEYCASSLTEIEFYNAFADEFLANTKKSFPKVESVCVVGGDFGLHLPKFAKWFPEMRRLEIHSNKNYVNAFFPRLEHLGVFINGSDYGRSKESVAALIRSHILQSLEINISSRFVEFNEFLKIVGIQPLITKLVVTCYIEPSTLDKRNLRRFESALPFLTELDLGHNFPADAAIVCTRKFNLLKKFHFLLPLYSSPEYLRQQLGDEWQISVDRFWGVTLERL